MTSKLELRRGDLVEIKSPTEILATLDDYGALDSLPFMPEMVRYCGQRFLVDARAEKVCDTATWTGSRRIPSAVLLPDLRCSGSGHGGCQADCRLFWKEAWLRKVGTADATARAIDDREVAALIERVSRHVRVASQAAQSPPRWSCQATQLPAASMRLSTFDPRVYWKEYSCGNVSLKRFIRVTARAAIEEPMRKLGFDPAVDLRGSGSASATAGVASEFHPGDLVQIKSKEEIIATLNAKGMNRGLSFDREMAPYCGGTYRLRQRIRQFINESNGQMIDLNTDCWTLEGVVCSGDLSQRRWFCPRAIYPFWREAWFRQTSSDPSVSESGDPAAETR